MLKTTFLKQIGLFEGFSEALLVRISQSLEKCKFHSGESIFKKGDEKGVLYLVKKGRVRVHNDSYTFIELSTTGFFGEYSLIDAQSRSATVTALEDCELWCLDKDSFERINQDFQELSNSVMTALIKRLRKMNELEQSLVRKNQEIENANQQLTDLNQEKSDLIGMMAHDLRNPLASAMSIVSLLLGEKETLNTEQQELLTITKNSLDRMNVMIGRTVESQMLESGLLELRMERTEISEILDTVVNNYKNRAEEKRIALVFTGLNHKVYANVDSSFFYQAVENLVSNALKFSNGDTEVKVHLKKNEKTISIGVIDQGPGIHPDEIPLLFKKYQKLSARPTAGEKSIGLGLFIVKKLAEKMGGTLECVSEVGKGTNFVLEFPSIA